MAPPRKTAKAKSGPSSNPNGAPPRPFKLVPESLKPFTQKLSKKHFYITHIDSKPKKFKRNIFLVPVAMNVATVLLFIWRVWYILPYYGKLVMSGLGNPNETTFPVGDSTWSQLSWEIGRRAITIMIDFLLFTFVLPEPVQFFFGSEHANPILWRWSVGFRDQEIYVRRSTKWDQVVLPDLFEKPETLQTFLAAVRQATAPMLLSEKTGYLTMSPAWSLDWQGMITATRLVDKKELAPEAFRTLVLLYHAPRKGSDEEGHGWLCLDLHGAVSDEEGRRRRQVLAFREALAAVGKEDVFFRWIEIVQFESTRPGGFGAERQEETATKIRELFQDNGIDFDEFWRESVGEEGLAGM